MNGQRLVIAALTGSLFALAGPGGAQIVHHYINVAAVTLPEPGNPQAVVFADVGSVRRTGDLATIDVVYALGEAQTFRGQPTTYVTFDYEIGCAAKTRKISHYDIHGSDGSLQPHSPNEAANPVQGALEQSVMNLACGAPTSAQGHTDIKGVLADAASFVRTQREQDSSLIHSFILTGAAVGSQLGAVEVFIDTANLTRSGDEVTAYSLEVFQRSGETSAQPGAYTINTVSFSCSSRTATTSYLVVYQVDGTPLQGGPAAAGARAVKPGSIQDTALNLVCKNAAPGSGAFSHPTVGEAVAAALKALSANGRH
jgi:hypothetical protein